MPNKLSEAGVATWTDQGSGKPFLVLGTSQCVHCGGHFPTPRFECTDAAKATRVGRGYCYNCNGYICGAGCLECIPEEQMLENIEKGRQADYKPIISVPG